MLTHTEENYLKTLYRLVAEKTERQEAGTNELAASLQVKPATANDMLKRLKEKKLIHYEKYGKIRLSAEGKRQALQIVRKHRLWETFLHDKLGFTWDEVHEVAEQLEHIQSTKLIERLDKFLNYPTTDPHGDLIPDAKGEMKSEPRRLLSEINKGRWCRIVAIRQDTPAFLQYVGRVGLAINTRIKVLNKEDFDGTMSISVNGQNATISGRFAENILVV